MGSRNEQTTPPAARSVLHWQMRGTRLALGPIPRLMGIVNVTPDSFSDGGKYFEPERAVEQALRLADEGADILDLGGESTRPYSTPVPAEEELRRVLPVVRSLVRQTKTPISIDTSKAAVARACLEAGAAIINDVTGLSGDAQMTAVARETGAGVCVMHMQGTPQTMQDRPTYGDVVAEIRDYLRTRRDALLGAGLAAESICLDPGIGFGKTHQHNLALLARCGELLDLGSPLLVGHSRKGFIGHVLGDSAADRAAGTLGVSLALARQGVHMLRVHDVRTTREAISLFACSGGLD